MYFLYRIATIWIYVWQSETPILRLTLNLSPINRKSSLYSIKYTYLTTDKCVIVTNEVRKNAVCQFCNYLRLSI